MTRTKQIEQASFHAWQHVQSAQFQLLMGYKHGAGDGAEKAMEYLQRAVAELEAAVPAKAHAAE